MIAAMAQNRIIGSNNQMPWHLPADLKHFKSVTLGKPVIMGRKTYESIGKALPGRHNIVITRSNKSLTDATTVQSLEAGLTAAGDVEEIMIIGGGQLYAASLELCDRLYLTHIDLLVEGDTQFPDYLNAFQWQQVATESHLADEKNPFNYYFETLDKIR